jgi:hypothetical protein
MRGGECGREVRREQERGYRERDTGRKERK